MKRPACSSPGSGPRPGLAPAALCLVCCALLLPLAASAAPTGGQVMNGSAVISQSGNTTDINQSSRKASINWQSFSIAPKETVNFNQPSASAMTLNRVIGNEKSVIAGALNANGKVYLINANGVLFARGSQVNVGGLVASTLNISDKDFMDDKFVFSSEESRPAAVINKGSITAAPGGYVALLGGEVINKGVITADMGTVALNSGQKISLNFKGDSLVSATIDKASLNALVENKKAIIADGGKVIMTARAAGDILSAQVNNTGLVQARGLGDLTGEITLNAYGGTTTVGGVLDASAPVSGNGGFIETSGDKVSIADSATITAKSAKGKDGAWLIDPKDFTVGAGGDMSGAALSAGLNAANVTIESSGGVKEGKGDIHINDRVEWNADTALTLRAVNDININNAIVVNGASARLELIFGGDYHIRTPASYSGAVVDGSAFDLNGNPIPVAKQDTSGGVYGSISFMNAANKDGLKINGDTYTLIHNLDDLAAVTGIAGNYALARNLDAGTLTKAVTPALTAEANAAREAAFAAMTTAIAEGEAARDAVQTRVRADAADAAYAAVIDAGGSVAEADAVKNALLNAAITQGYIDAGAAARDAVTAVNGANAIADAVRDAVVAAKTSGLAAADAAQQAVQTRVRADAADAAYAAVLSAGGTVAQADASKDAVLGTGIAHAAAVVGAEARIAVINAGGTIAAGGIARDAVLAAAVGNNAANPTVAADAAKNSVLTTSNSVVQTLAAGSTLAGLGHSIDKLTITSAAADNVGLIGTAGTGTLIRDLGVTNVNITQTGSGQYIGALVGSSQGNLRQVYSTGDITASGTSVGGLAGSMSTAVTRAERDENNKVIQVRVPPVALSDSFSEVNIRHTAATAGNHNVGGLVGAVSNVDISHAHATGDIIGTDKNSYMGGLIGRFSNVGSVHGSYATGNVTGNTFVGGLIGFAQASYSGMIIDSCFALGDVASFGAQTSNTTGGAGTGGLIGYLGTMSITDYWPVTLKNSHAEGNVTSELATSTGGLVGRAQNIVTIDAGYATGNVTGGGMYAGGLVGSGYAVGTSAMDENGKTVRDENGQLIIVGHGLGVSNSYATGNVSGEHYVGGLVGNGFTISNSWASGDVSGYMRVGGLAGSAVEIVGSHASGAVFGSSSQSVGGLVGAKSDGFNNYHKDNGIRDSYYNTETSGMDRGVGSGANPNYEMGLSNEQYRDVRHYIDGAIDRVLAGRAEQARAAEQAPEQASQAAQAAVQAQATALSASVARTAGSIASTGSRLTESASMLPTPTDRETSLASALGGIADMLRSVVNPGEASWNARPGLFGGAKYSATVRTMTTNGVTYTMDETDETGKEGE